MDLLGGGGGGFASSMDQVNSTGAGLTGNMHLGSLKFNSGV